MVRSRILEALKIYGFSEKEAAIYITTLELGSPTAQQISERSGLNRSTVYDVIRALIAQGIMSSAEKNTTRYFEAAGPQRLLGILEEKRNRLQSVMQEIKVLQDNPLSKPKVKVFVGKEGFNTILEDILYTKRHTDVISTSKIFDIMRFNFPHFIMNRSKLNITARVIQEESRQTQELKKTDKEQFRETRSLKNWTVNSMTFIYANKTAIIKLVKEEIICIVIEDEILSDDNRKIFEILWNTAK